MAIRTIETVTDIKEDRKLVVQLPPDVPVGRHRVVTMLDLAAENAKSVPPEILAFPIIEDAHWPSDMPLTRQEMYDDDGR